MAFDPRCTRCGRRCFGEIEVEMLFCDRCTDEEITRHNKQREWDHYHSDIDHSEPESPK